MELELKQEQAAELMGTSACTFGKKINNKSEFTISEAVYLMKILEINMSDFENYFLCGYEE